MANTSIIHCGRGRERMEVDFYAKLDWQLSLCPLYLRWVGVRGTSSYRLAGSKQSWHVCNQGILDQFNLRWHFTYNWEEMRISLNPYIFHEVQAGWHFCQADWVKMQFKSCRALFDSSQEPSPGQALISQCYGFSVGGNHISHQQYTVEYAEYTVKYTEYTGIRHWDEPMLCHEWEDQSNLNYCRISSARHRLLLGLKI